MFRCILPSGFLFAYINGFGMKLVIWIETESLHFLVHGRVEDGLENIDSEGLFSRIFLDLFRDSVAFFSVHLGDSFFDPPIQVCVFDVGIVAETL
jgi:hypothetical protein